MRQKQSYMKIRFFGGPKDGNSFEARCTNDSEPPFVMNYVHGYDKESNQVIFASYSAGPGIQFGVSWKQEYQEYHFLGYTKMFTIVTCEKSATE